MGGGDAPKPSEEERQLQAMQTRTLAEQNAALRKQYAEQELLAPILYKQAGIRPIYEEGGGGGAGGVRQFIESTGNADFKAMASEYLDRTKGTDQSIEGFKNFIAGAGDFNQKSQLLSEIGSFQPTKAGRIVGYEEIEDEESKLRKDISLQLLKRSQAALQGNLPVDPALERSLQEEEQTLKDIMEQRLGPGWETSTPGIEAMNDLRAKAEELRYAVRRDTLTTSEALSAARQGANEQRLYGGTAAASRGSMTVAEMFGQNVQGLNTAVGGLRQERMQSGANAAQGKSAMIGGGAALVGTAAGIAIAM